jgi:hypothetical protein
MADVDPWRMEKPHETYTKSDVKRGATDHVQFRADSFHIRRIDEILGQRLDSAFKTRSDVFQDAIVMWLEDWDLKHPDGAAGELHYKFAMEQQKRQRVSRREYLETVKEELDDLRKDADVEGLRALARNIISASEELKHTAPPKYIAELDQILADTRRMLDPQ